MERLVFDGKSCIECQVVFKLPLLWVSTRTRLNDDAAATRDVGTVEAQSTDMNDRSTGLQTQPARIT